MNHNRCARQYYEAHVFFCYTRTPTSTPCVLASCPGSIKTHSTDLMAFDVELFHCSLKPTLVTAHLILISWFSELSAGAVSNTQTSSKGFFWLFATRAFALIQGHRYVHNGLAYIEIKSIRSFLQRLSPSFPLARVYAWDSLGNGMTRKLVSDYIH